MDTKTQIQLAIEELRKSFSDKSKKKAEASLSILQELLERKDRKAESLERNLRDVHRTIESMKSEPREIVDNLLNEEKNLLNEKKLELEKREMDLSDREKVPSPEYIQTKKRLNDSDHLLIKYLDDSLKPATKQHVEYYIKEDRDIRERLDKLTKLTDKISEAVSEVHEAPIPDEAKKLMATLADKLERNTVTEEGSQSKTAQGVFKRLMEEWLAPGFVGAGVAVAALWSFIMVPSAVVMVDGSTDIFQKPYIQNVTGQYPIPTYRGGEVELNQNALALKGVITRVLEDRYELSKITQGETEIIINLRGAFVSEKGEHCDSGELSYVDKVAFFIGCRETENNWNIKFSE